MRHFRNICTIKSFPMKKFERSDDSKLQPCIGCLWLLTATKNNQPTKPIISRNFKLYQVQCSVVNSRGAVQSSTLQCTANQQFAIHQSSMQSRELNSCALKLYIYLCLLCSEVQCMRKKCSVVWWIKCRPVLCCRVHSSPPPSKPNPLKKKKNPYIYFFFYWCVYSHRSRDSVSPVCGIFF